MRWPVMLLALVAACRSGGGPRGPQPPAPGHGAHANPPRVVATAPGGRLQLPPGTRLAFALGMGGNPVLGDWDVSGTVRAVAKGRITFNSQGRTGDLLYRLPARMVLRVAVGDEISVRRKIRLFLAARGYTVSVMAANRLVVAAGRVKGNEPRANKFVGLTLEQGQPGRTLGGGSRLETTREVPLTLKFGQNSIELPLGRNFDFNVGNRAFRTHIPMSIHVKPRQAAAEGRGYTLEYVVVGR